MVTILVVDDETDIRELLRLCLEREGHQVVEAADGEAALRAMSESRPDAVLLDVMMPVMDGFEVLERAKAAGDDVADIPVLMLTALGDDLDRIRGGIEGAIRYLVKPFALEDVRSAVREVLAAGPESAQRRQAQQQALAAFARREAGQTGRAPANVAPRLTKLERPRDSPRPPAEAPLPTRASLRGILSAKQLELVDAVAATETVRDAAERLKVSRSNVYASLRRVARKTGVASVHELVILARQGRFADVAD